jgi:ferredoxin-type protein NapH
MDNFAWHAMSLKNNMRLIEKIKAIPEKQKYRYIFILVSCLLFLAPFTFLPGLFGNDDLCGKMCMRRFFLYFPGMTLEDLNTGMTVAWAGVVLLSSIFISTFFYGRIWCSYICPAGGFPEMVSRTLNDRWKIEYRSLPQVPIRYGYFAVYLLLMPTLGISACTLCNFITVPRLFESLSGGVRGLAFLFSTVGLVNLALLLLLGFFASKGRAYCQFLCPIGAMDGLINRIGAKLRFTRRIRVERDRCTGCNICARNCMTGAIKMVDQVAVVDQLSCMSCHECVDVCDWHAIDWLTLPPDNQPKRKKKGVDFHPLPEWEAVHFEKPKAKGLKAINWQRVVLGIIIGLGLIFFIATQAQAKQRQADPDGCLSCHALEGLEYIDKNGVLRNSTIDKKHYLSSLHGSVPCKDCHRKTQDYPHKVENTEVDCSESCHLEEPSEGEAYTHKKVTEVFEKSIHGEGKSKGFTGGNRFDESTKQQNPSCRLCHNNSLYIDPEKLSDFKAALSHTETECGSCHQGKTWLNQFGGHIMRRFLSGRQNKEDENNMCNNCHADKERMKQVEIKDKATGKTHNAGNKFILASDTYEMSLHGRLLANGNEAGVSCNDCHTPEKEKHAIQGHKDRSSTTHTDNLDKTCSFSGCHQFSKNYINSKFTQTDMHDLDFIPVYEKIISTDFLNLNTGWKQILAFLAPIIIILILGSIIWSLFSTPKKSVVFSLFGGNHFQKIMIGRKPKSKTKRSKVKRSKPNIRRTKGDQ